MGQVLQVGVRLKALPHRYLEPSAEISASISTGINNNLFYCPSAHVRTVYLWCWLERKFSGCALRPAHIIASSRDHAAF